MRRGTCLLCPRARASVGTLALVLVCTAPGLTRAASEHDFDSADEPDGTVIEVRFAVDPDSRPGSLLYDSSLSDRVLRFEFRYRERSTVELLAPRRADLPNVSPDVHLAQAFEAPSNPLDDPAFVRSAHPAPVEIVEPLRQR